MELQLPKGTRDFPPEQKLLRDSVVRTLTTLFERFGFNPLETPVLERWEVLSAKMGASDETDVMKEVYRLKDQGGRELGLRYDLTVPTARFVSMNPQLKMPFKRYQVGNVFRDGPIKLGRYREFIQCDFDIFGCKKLTADAEILQVFLDAFKTLELDATMEVNNRKLLTALIAQAGVSEEQAETVMITIDKLDKQGDDGVKKELLGKGIEGEVVTKLLGYFQITGTNEERLAALEKELPKDKHEGIAELRELLTYVKDVVINPALARGLAYYTGTVFEGRLNNAEITSSICSGGRYDNLVGVLLGKASIPAVGGSFGLEPITEYLRLRAKGQQGGLPKTAVELFVIPIKCYEQALSFVNQLREAGINTEIDLTARGISKNLEYANALDIHYVVIVGPKELEAGKVKLKDMRTGDESLLSLDEVTAKLA
jgi:histidyl-tRNA synthetase